VLLNGEIALENAHLSAFSEPPEKKFSAPLDMLENFRLIKSRGG
jgi:hypothetical protein